MPFTRTTAVKVLAVPLVAAVVLVGIWATGALLTNDFALAMLLTAAWMGFAGLAALLIAIRSRTLRWPVLGAYAVTSAAAALYLGSSTFLDNEIDERVAVAPPVTEAMGDAGTAPAEPRAEASAATQPPPENVQISSGGFVAVRHPAAGRATVIDLAEGGRVLTLTDFDVDNGPDLRVYLVAGSPTTESEVTDVVDLGALKGNQGDQQYELSPEVDVGRHDTVVIWCRAFSVLFAQAPLQQGG